MDKLKSNKPIILIANIALMLLAFFFYAKTFPAQWQKVMIWLLPDSDDLMRVVEVRAWLNGEGFFDLINHRANPPIGTEMHWSRLSDLPLAIGEIIFRQFTDVNMAERLAVFWTPVVLLIIFASINGITANKIFKGNFTFAIAFFFTILCDSTFTSFAAGRVDHHSLQLISLSVMMFGLISQNFKGGIIAGLSLAASLTIGFEMLPLQIWAVAWVAIIWAFKGESKNQLVFGFCLALSIGLLAGFVINVAPGQYLNGVNDRLSIAQLVPILMGCIFLGLGAHYFSKTTILKRFIVLVIIGVFVIIAALQYPVLFKQLYWQIGPLLREIWYNRIGDVLPFMVFPIRAQLNVGLFLVLASLASAIKAFLVFKKEGANQDFENWVLLSSLTIIATSMTFFFQTRIHIQAADFAVLVSAPIISQMYKDLSLRNALIGTLILNPQSPHIVAKAYTNMNAHKANHVAFGGDSRCRSQPNYTHIASQSKGLLAMNLDHGAVALIMTPHDIIATPFHRDTGKEFIYDMFLSTPEIAKQKILARGIDYVAVCKASGEIPAMTRYRPDSLMAAIGKGQIPAYLQEIPKPSGSDVLAYKVIK